MFECLGFMLHFTFNNLFNLNIFQRSTINYTNVFWTKNQAKDFCIAYMNESAGYKACLDVPNVKPEHAIADCVADIQVFCLLT